MKHEENGHLQVAIVGLGAAAERIILPGLCDLPHIELVAAFDLDESKRSRAGNHWQIRRLYSNLQAMLATEKPDIVVIATPPLTHFEVAQVALDYGCHVFCEKPFMPSLEQADQIVAAARERQLSLTVNSQYYQMPIYRKTQEMIDAGEVGRPFRINAWQQMYLLPHEEGGWKAELQPRRVLFEFGTHAIDLVCRFFGDLPHAVTARISKVRKDVEADVCLDVRLDFAGERTAHLSFNRMSFAPKRYFELRLDCQRACLRSSLGGVAYLGLSWNSNISRPQARLSLSRGGETRLEHEGRSRLLQKQSASAYSDATAAHFAAFACAVRDGHDPVPSIAYGREVLRILLACYESAEAGGVLVRL